MKILKIQMFDIQTFAMQPLRSLAFYALDTLQLTLYRSYVSAHRPSSLPSCFAKDQFIRLTTWKTFQFICRLAMRSFTKCCTADHMTS